MVKLAPIVIIILIALLGLFSPIPYYEKDNKWCESNPPTLCSSKGWHLSASLWEKFSGELEKPVSTSIKPSVSEYPKYGHADDYSWVAGRVKVNRIEGGCIYVDFSDKTAEENYLGNITIRPQELAREQNLKHGDFVVLKGQLGKPRFSMSCPVHNYETDEILFH